MKTFVQLVRLSDIPALASGFLRLSVVGLAAGMVSLPVWATPAASSPGTTFSKGILDESGHLAGLDINFMTRGGATGAAYFMATETASVSDIPERYHVSTSGYEAYPHYSSAGATLTALPSGDHASYPAIPRAEWIRENSAGHISLIPGVITLQNPGATSNIALAVPEPETVSLMLAGLGR